jgi:hypothetical protein
LLSNERSPSPFAREAPSLADTLVSSLQVGQQQWPLPKPNPQELKTQNLNLKNSKLKT